jgi:hypothetical protein
VFVVAVAFTWAGYAVGGWGWCLIRGYNITFTQWVNPVNFYEWPDGKVPVTPDTQVLPSGQSQESQAHAGGA